MNTRMMTTRKIAGPAQGAGSTAPAAGAGGQQGAGATARAPASVPSERIQARAYEIFRARNGGGGDALTDWLQAEREVRGSGRPAEPAGVEAEDRRGPSSTTTVPPRFVPPRPRPGEPASL